MTAPDPRVGEIEAIPTEAVEAAAKAIHDAGDWEVPWTGSGWQAECARNEAEAALAAAHPYLLAELADRDEKLARVEALAKYLDTLADGDKHYAGLIRAAVAAANGGGDQCLSIDAGRQCLLRPGHNLDGHIYPAEDS